MEKEKIIDSEEDSDEEFLLFITDVTDKVVEKLLQNPSLLLPPPSQPRDPYSIPKPSVPLPNIVDSPSTCQKNNQQTSTWKKQTPYPMDLKMHQQNSKINGGQTKQPARKYNGKSTSRTSALVKERPLDASLFVPQLKRHVMPKLEDLKCTNDSTSLVSVEVEDDTGNTRVIDFENLIADHVVSRSMSRDIIVENDDTCK